MADKVFTVRMPDTMRDKIKGYAKFMHLSESEAIRDLVSIAFDYMAKPAIEHPGVVSYRPATAVQLANSIGQITLK